jgi:enoyl-[acyl-carrier protein] reductase/trans-2-enoyl-CoA reductase (NAD+)
VVAFADYDFEPDNPVYGMGPLAGAKRLQRQSMVEIKQKHRVHTTRICYPAMNTTAISAIPGGVLMYAATATALGDKRQTLPELAAATMPIFGEAVSDLRLDSDYQAALARVNPLVAAIDERNWRSLIAGAFES